MELTIYAIGIDSLRVVVLARDQRFCKSDFPDVISIHHMKLTKEVTMIGIIRGVCAPAMLVFVVFLAGCAFGTRQPTLIYPPAMESGGT